MSSVGINVSIVRGTLSRTPQQRALPSGDVLTGFEVTVRPEGGPTDSVPVTWLAAPQSCLGWQVGDEVVAVGRVERRFFKSGGMTQSRTTVAASTVAHVRQKAKARRAAEAAVAEVCDALGLAPSL